MWIIEGLTNQSLWLNIVELLIILAVIIYETYLIVLEIKETQSMKCICAVTIESALVILSSMFVYIWNVPQYLLAFSIITGIVLIFISSGTIFIETRSNLKNKK